MKFCAVAGLGLLLTLGCASAAHAAPIDTLEDCGKHVAPNLKGMEALEELCPGLEDALLALGLPNRLPAQWRVDLTLQALRDMSRLTMRYHGEPAGRAPESASLHAILATLKAEQTVKPRSWFEMLIEWLRSLFSKTDDRSLSWLQRLLDKVDAASGLIGIATYALLALILIGALVFIGVELRSAGLIGRRARVPAKPGGALASPLPGASSDSDLDAAALYEKPSILLRTIVTTLAGQGRLTANRHLTHRELVDQVTLDAAQRRQFGQLASVAEQILYGPAAPSVEIVNAALREGRGLLTQVNPLVGTPG